jgi:hypothetical protein
MAKRSTKTLRDGDATKSAREKLATFDAILLQEFLSFREAGGVSREQMEAERQRLGVIPRDPLAAALARLRNTEKRFRSLAPDSRSVCSVRKHMTSELSDCIMLLALLCRDEQGRVMFPTALLELSSALHDICKGKENALLVPANRSVGSNKFLPSHHRYVRAKAAAIVEFLVIKGKMQKLAAGAVVARRLSKAGYRLPGNSKASRAIRDDTVKRWPERERAKAGFSTFNFSLELWSECVIGPDAAKWVAEEELAKLAAYCRHSALQV